MAQSIGPENRSILEDRPTISFIEPKVLPVVAQPAKAEPNSLDTVIEDVRKTKALANAVDVLASVMQARVDIQAKDMAIDLDPKVDATVIAAVKRLYPDDDPTVVTYQQYKICKDRLRARGDELADQALTPVSPQAIADARTAMYGTDGSGVGIDPYTDYEGTKNAALSNSKQAKRGGLRPELDKKSQVIEPLDIDALQDFLIRILVNFTWKTFIKPVFIPIRIPMLGGLGDLLPNIIAKYPKGVKIGDLLSMGLPILGQKKPKQQEPPKTDPNAITNAGKE